MFVHQLHPIARGNQFNVFVSADGNLIVENSNCEIVADYPAPSEVMMALGLDVNTEELPVVRVQNG